MLAIEGLVELHIPPTVALLNKVVDSTQTSPDPVIDATIGNAFTVIFPD